MLSQTTFQPLYGRLSDIFGRKPCLIFANVVFLIGTLGCALAPGIWTLVASRMVAGMGGGGLNVLVHFSFERLSLIIRGWLYCPMLSRFATEERIRGT